ncbi:MAG: hypothetical protein CXZ00_05090 [Acidobacteria bacterium]|nr:MAG: hypothetical protein CXZ00_05090 [Acidobacteriota bacterium]
MSEEDRWKLLVALDEELLHGGVILSEWCSFLVRESDVAFANGAYLACILTALSAIETHLRSEFQKSGKKRLVDLIDSSDLEPELVCDLHTLRRYRNQWVHVSDPWDDQELIQNPVQCEDELGRMAVFAVRALRRTIYSNPWI